VDPQIRDKSSRQQFRQAAMWIAFSVIAVSLLGAAAEAQTQANVPPADLNGFWTNQYTPNLAQAYGKELPFTAYGAERWKNVDTANDPTGLCLPPGPSRALTAPLPLLIVQSAGMVGLLFEYQTVWRVIYMDGRGHPEDVADYPYFMGHSIGRWEGDTLVVDTVGINERSWLDTAGHEHSDKLHLTERFRKTAPDTIQWSVTFDDPAFFTEPWTITRNLTRSKPTDRILDYACNENNKDIPHLVPNTPNK
jgi:hypothetical protein